MRVLVTSSRMPSAIDQIRKLGRRGHTVFTADTFDTSPGGHSRYARSRTVVSSPRHETSRFVDDIGRLVKNEQIELILPAFEEGYFLSEHRARLPGGVKLFTPRYETILELHDKSRFTRVARELGIRVPEEILVTDERDLEPALRHFERFVAKPVFSRGGVDIFSNVGTLASGHRPRACTATPERPWVVQEFIAGVDVCTYSIAREGRLTAHTTYVHPREIEHAGGIVFHSIEDGEALEHASAVAGRYGYDGGLSLDFRRDAKGLVALECNPRPTAGVHLMSDEAFEEALLGTPDRLHVTPAGIRRKYSAALVRDIALHFADADQDLRHLFSDAREVVATWDDPLPALYQFFSYSLVVDFRKRRGGKATPTDLAAAYFDHVAFDGPEHRAVS